MDTQDNKPGYDPQRSIFELKQAGAGGQQGDNAVQHQVG